MWINEFVRHVYTVCVGHLKQTCWTGMRQNYYLSVLSGQCSNSKPPPINPQTHMRPMASEYAWRSSRAEAGVSEIWPHLAGQDGATASTASKRGTNRSVEAWVKACQDKASTRWSWRLARGLQNHKPTKATRREARMSCAILWRATIETQTSGLTCSKVRAYHQKPSSSLKSVERQK